MHSKHLLIFSIAFVALNDINVATANEGILQSVGEDWKLIRQIEGVDIFRRKIPGSSFPAFLAHARIDATVNRVFEVISDYDNFAKFIPSVSESQILEQHDDRVCVYHRLAMPMLFSDRHYVIKVINDLSHSENGTIRVSWALDRERMKSFISDAMVQPDEFTGFWTLAKTPEGSDTDAIYSIHVEPGGKVPVWLFTKASARYVFDVIQAVRKQAR
jgi:hypothetical protein